MNNFLKKCLNEMAYPDEFDFEVLKKFSSFQERLMYVKSHLKSIGTGSGRSVFYVDEEKVLKVAKNRKGLSQNETEINLRNKTEICAKIFDYDNEHRFLEMEYAKKISEKKFIELEGFSPSQFQRFFRFYLWSSDPEEYFNSDKFGKNNRIIFDIENGKELIKTIESSKLAKNIFEFAKENNFILPSDFGSLNSYGLVTRNKKETIVLRDFGLTMDVLSLRYRGYAPEISMIKKYPTARVEWYYLNAHDEEVERKQKEKNIQEE